MSGQPEDDRGIWIDDFTWSALCKKGKFRCVLCGNHPRVEDAEHFADEGCCRDCDEEWERTKEKWQIFERMVRLNKNGKTWETRE